MGSKLVEPSNSGTLRWKTGKTTVTWLGLQGDRPVIGYKVFHLEGSQVGKKKNYGKTRFGRLNTGGVLQIFRFSELLETC